MGVDAEMFVRIKGREKWLSDEAVNRLAYEIGSSFGADFFFTKNPSDGLFGDEKRRALQIMEPVRRDGPHFDEETDAEFVGKVVWTQDGDPIIAAADEQFIKVNLYHRYYGAGYERGDWPRLRSCIAWLTARIPSGTVWYGGDSSGACAEECTAEFMADLDQHWFNSGRRPYVRYESHFKFAAMPSDGIKPPVCQLCDVPMADCGGSRDYTFFWCDGCGVKASAHANGKVAWAKRHHDYPSFSADGEPVERPKSAA